MDIITRKQAQEQGLTRYFTGKPCLRGHVAERQTTNGKCQACQAEDRKALPEEQKEKARQRARRRYQENPDERKAAAQAWRANNKEHLAAYNKQFAKQYAVKRKQLNKSHYAANPEAGRRRVAQYRNDNPDAVREYKAKQRRERTPAYVADRLRIRLNECLRRVGARKSAATTELTGIDAKELKEYLALQFAEGMSWDNYGEWHIDHIRPCASFDLTDPAQQRECFHYTNLQPLWAEDNLRKSDKWEELAA
jgi:hypothetical protein